MLRPAPLWITMLTGTTPAEFEAYFQSDMDNWRKVVKASGVSGD
jgi:hypothetical protein